jgi:hypothetical protein
MSELDQFRVMLTASGHKFSVTPLDEEEAPGYMVVSMVPDVHKEMLLRFTFDDDGDLSSFYPDWPQNWRVTVD